MIKKKDALVMACALQMNIKHAKSAMERAQKDIVKYEAMENTALMSYNMGLVDGLKRATDLMQKIRDLIPTDMHWV